MGQCAPGPTVPWARQSGTQVFRASLKARCSERVTSGSFAAEIAKTGSFHQASGRRPHLSSRPHNPPNFSVGRSFVSKSMKPKSPNFGTVYRERPHSSGHSQSRAEKTSAELFHLSYANRDQFVLDATEKAAPILLEVHRLRSGRLGCKGSISRPEALLAEMSQTLPVRNLNHQTIKRTAS